MWIVQQEHKNHEHASALRFWDYSRLQNETTRRLPSHLLSRRGTKSSITPDLKNATSAPTQLFNSKKKK